MAQSFDVDELMFDGEAVPVAGELTPGSERLVGHRYSASGTGVLVYRSGGAGIRNSRLLWHDRRGNQVGQVGSPDAYTGVHLAPDGERVAVHTFNAEGVRHSWMGDLGRDFFTRIYPGDVPDYAAVPSATGHVAVTMVRDQAVGDIYGGVPNETGPPRPWVENANVKHSNNFSPDGRFLIYDEHDPIVSAQDLWILQIGTDGAALGEPIPFLTTPADESFGQFSPDGEWIAYYSDDSGQQEIFVRGFSPESDPPFSATREQISTAGGGKPRWSRDGTELYYVSFDGYMMAVPIETGSGRRFGVPKQLFEMPRVSVAFFSYDVSTAGRFLIVTAEESTERAVVVMNWTTTLEP